VQQASVGHRRHWQDCIHVAAGAIRPFDVATFHSVKGAAMKRFTENAALLLIDIQKGVDALEHWGGPSGRRNNPGAE